MANVVLGPFAFVCIVAMVVDVVAPCVVCASMVESIKEVVFVLIVVFLGVVVCSVVICFLEVSLDVVASFVDIASPFVVKDVLPSLYENTENKIMIFSIWELMYVYIFNAENVCRTQFTIKNK